MTEWGLLRKEKELHRFYDAAIKLSQMVRDGRLNSTGAKTVFSELYDAHKRNLNLINQIDGMWS